MTLTHAMTGRLVVGMASSAHELVSRKSLTPASWPALGAKPKPPPHVLLFLLTYRTQDPANHTVCLYLRIEPCIDAKLALLLATKPLCVPLLLLCHKDCKIPTRPTPPHTPHLTPPPLLWLGWPAVAPQTRFHATSPPSPAPAGSDFVAFA